MGIWDQEDAGAGMDAVLGRINAAAQPQRPAGPTSYYQNRARLYQQQRGRPWPASSDRSSQLASELRGVPLDVIAHEYLTGNSAQPQRQQLDLNNVHPDLHGLAATIQGIRGDIAQARARQGARMPVAAQAAPEAQLVSAFAPQRPAADMSQARDQTGLGDRMRALASIPVAAAPASAGPLSREATLAKMAENRRAYIAAAQQMNPERNLLSVIGGLDPNSVDPVPSDPSKWNMPQERGPFGNRLSFARNQEERQRQGRVVTAAIANRLERQKGLDPLTASLMAKSELPMAKADDRMDHVAAWSPVRQAGGGTDDALNQMFMAHLLGPQNYAAHLEAKSNAERNANQRAQNEFVMSGARELQQAMFDGTLTPQERARAGNMLANHPNAGLFAGGGGMGNIPANPEEERQQGAVRQAADALKTGAPVQPGSHLDEYLRSVWRLPSNNAHEWWPDILGTKQARLAKFLSVLGDQIPRVVAERWFHQQGFNGLGGSGAPTYPPNFVPAGAGS